MLPPEDFSDLPQTLCWKRDLWNMGKCPTLDATSHFPNLHGGESYQRLGTRTRLWHLSAPTTAHTQVAQ